MNNHLAQCTEDKCEIKHMCKRYATEPTRPTFNFKWLFKSRGWKCFVHLPKESKKD